VLDRVRRRPGAPARTTRLVIDGRVLVDDHFSGIGHYTMHLLGALDRLLDDEPGVRATVAVPANRRAGLARYGFRNLRPLSLPITYWMYRRLLAADRLPRMDLLLGPATYFFPDYVRWPLARSRSVTAVHDLSFVKVPEAVDAGNRRFLAPRVARAVATSDAVTALTATMAAEITEEYGVEPERVHVVGCAADTRHFYRRSDREIVDVTRRYGIFGEYVVSVGNIEPRKNHVRLIDAFCRLPADLAERFTLVFVGAGAWNDHEVRRRIDAALAAGWKIAVLLGTVTDDDLPALYSGATASAYVSTYEGFGMPPLESMAVGTPVLGSDVSVMPEVMGDAAVLVDPYDPADMADGLERLLRLEGPARAELVARGHANVARYRWDDAARSLLDTVRSVGDR